MEKFKERRKYPRIEKKLPLKVKRIKEFDIATKTENISCSGAYCQVNRKISPMTKLDIVLFLPLRGRRKISLRRIECKAVVVRTEKFPKKKNKFNIAMYFTKMRPQDRKKIAEYVNYHLAS